MNSEPTLKNLTKADFGVPPKEQNVLLQQLGIPHVDSFDYMLKYGLDLAIADLVPVQFELPNGDRFKAEIIKSSLSCPLVPAGTVGSKKPTVLPSECRQSKITYSGKFAVRIRWYLNDLEQDVFDKDLGDIPIMLKSRRCHLRMMSPEQLVKNGEHEQEWGGYFIAKGLHRLVRMLLMQRRNYPVCIQRSSWKQRGKMFSDLGVSIRSVREDQTATTNVLHFITSGSVKLMFSFRKVMYYAPLVLLLKCFCDYSDQYIYKKLTEGYEDDLYYSDCVQKMLHDLHDENLHTSEMCKDYLGMMFRLKFFECPPWYTNSEIADYILEKTVLIHLKTNEDKFNMLVFMTQKLFQFTGEKCRLEGVDSVMMQEVMLGGHLYLQVLKEKMQYWLYSLKTVIMKKVNNEDFHLTTQEMINICRIAGGISHSLDSFISTGAVTSVSGLGLMQNTGLTIVPENINFMRYMSHFKAVHRGSFFQEMRTTEARQLLPDAWGFICPVHTPDGTPCGLLNHLTMNCLITNIPDNDKLEKIPSVLADLGMICHKQASSIDFKSYYVVQLDGRVLGYVHTDIAEDLVTKLRSLKIKHVIPNMTEIVMIPLKKYPAQFPGLFLFTGPARMMRPLINLKANQVEYVGTFEQVYMDVCVKPSEMYKGLTTHMELSKDGFLSNLAQLIPMPDCNQSPRNMYQCQMGKQTMGTPCHNWHLEAETKLYRLQTPTSPLFRPVHHDHINLDDFGMGTNAIVAVISYTGYDMEDAMVINKASLERGLAHGSIYKTEYIMLDHSSSYFCRDPTNEQLANNLDTDGLPYIGQKLNKGQPFYCYYDADSSLYRVVPYSIKEECFVTMVKLCVDMKSNKRAVNFTLRITRNPSVGDKFASRAGQKGICSQKWPTEDLPFTESGLVPDIVFNPHGFPSRMTIAMMIEIMAGKSAAIHGLVHDASPFKFSEDNTAINYFGKLLEAGGYNYYGTETMYSGIDGREMTAQIFFGIVHYQRLRHMVSDKWQVRSTGPLDILTRQPLKGRKRGGGVRFGEMERDSLISHGTSFLLQDRLLHCSDKTRMQICTNCNSLLGPSIIVTQLGEKKSNSEIKQECRFCGNDDNISEIHAPYIFKFFVTQLASCNINVKVECKKI